MTPVTFMGWNIKTEMIISGQDTSDDGVILSEGIETEGATIRIGFKDVY